MAAPEALQDVTADVSAYSAPVNSKCALTITMPTAMYADLKEIADAAGQTMASIVREACRCWLYMRKMDKDEKSRRLRLAMDLTQRALNEMTLLTGAINPPSTAAMYLKSPFAE